jgi:hypothetical protein
MLLHLTGAGDPGQLEMTRSQKPLFPVRMNILVAGLLREATGLVGAFSSGIETYLSNSIRSTKHRLFTKIQK